MSQNGKVSNVLGDRQEEGVTTPLSEHKSSTKYVEEGTDVLEYMPLMENKSSTNNVDKGTDELADMKQSVVTTRRKGVNQFEGQSIG